MTTATVTSIAPASIRPKVKGESDFFSWQLFRWIRNHPQKFHVYAGTWNRATGIDPSRLTLYIGDAKEEGGWVNARQLTNLCTRNANLAAWAYSPAHDVENWRDVTDEFWDAYMRIGVCAIHGDHAHKWDVHEDTRKCEYCGKVENQQTRMVEKREWVAVSGGFKGFEVSQ